MKSRLKNAPNIVLISADQLRSDFVGCYGNNWINTPNIDSIASEGCLFRNAFSPNPVCIPARHNLLTGLPARFHGFDDNYFGAEARPCPYYLPVFPQILSDCGYATAAIGKMHFQPERRSTGFDVFLNSDEVVYDISEDDYAKDLVKEGFGNVGSIHGVRNILYMQPQRSLLPEKLHGSMWVGDKSVEYIRSRTTRKDRPFLLWAGFIHPHPPFDIPDGWAHLYDGKVPKPTKPLTPLCQIAEENKRIAFLPDDETVNRMRELYACAVSLVDYNVGRILKALDENGFRENTLVVFLSDHGEMLGDLGTYQKFLPYDASMKIPMVIRWPERIAPGTVFEDFCDLNDVLPTFLDAAGADYPADYRLPGASLLTENTAKDRSYQYGEFQHGNKRWCCIRTHRYLLVHHYGGPEELYNLKSDPEQRRNLLYGATNAKTMNIRDSLAAVLAEHESVWGLEGYVKDGSFVDFPEYSAQPFREGCFPMDMKRNPSDPPLDNLLDEALKAIEKEPLVKVSNLEVDSILLPNGFSQRQIDDFKKKAALQGN